MPSINKTPNVGLNHWKGNEYIIRQDWVDDNLAIDNKIKEIEDNVKEIKVPSNPSDIGAETPTGAQEKANKAETNAKAYTDKKIETVNASLDTKANLVDGKIPVEELPPMDFIATSEKGAVNGVATLDEKGKIKEGINVSKIEPFVLPTPVTIYSNTLSVSNSGTEEDTIIIGDLDEYFKVDVVINYSASVGYDSGYGTGTQATTVYINNKSVATISANLDVASATHVFNSVTKTITRGIDLTKSISTLNDIYFNLTATADTTNLINNGSNIIKLVGVKTGIRVTRSTATISIRGYKK